jgi:hypothetical protein
MTTKIKCNTLADFIKCPILKNKLELNTGDASYSQYRKTKEDTLFHKAYENCIDSDRVKYGSLNLKNLISGDPLAAMYGDTNIFYKNDIKDRISFLYGNSESDIMYVCTFKFFKHLLYHMPICDIKLLIESGVRTLVTASPRVQANDKTNYIECLNKLMETCEIIFVDKNNGSSNNSNSNLLTHQMQLYNKQW